MRWNGSVTTHIPAGGSDMDDRRARMNSLDIIKNNTVRMITWEPMVVWSR
ncbi:MAG: hypothetical protein Q8Q58_03015 [Candidatus Rokubacteria bacterium]|nr:hypothetical protein [Candidatus Rokubacteria bacterium]